MPLPLSFVIDQIIDRRLAILFIAYGNGCRAGMVRGMEENTRKRVVVMEKDMQKMIIC